MKTKHETLENLIKDKFGESGKQLIQLIDDLGWEVQRMTSCGEKTYDKIWKILEGPKK